MFIVLQTLFVVVVENMTVDLLTSVASTGRLWTRMMRMRKRKRRTRRGKAMATCCLGNSVLIVPLFCCSRETLDGTT